jgi:hypothetical protein
MGSSNGAHRVRRWFIIEEKAAAAVDLQIDEAGRKQGPGRHRFDWPVTRSLISRRDTLNHPTINQDDGIIVPSISIENTLSRNCKLKSAGVFGWFWTHRITSSLAGFIGPADPRSTCRMHCLGARRTSGTQGANKRSRRYGQTVSSLIIGIFRE